MSAMTPPDQINAVSAAERAVLTIALCDPASIDRMMPLSMEDFANPFYANVWESVCQLRRGPGVSFVGVMADLTTRCFLSPEEQATAARALQGMSYEYLHSESAASCAEQVRAHAANRLARAELPLIMDRLSFNDPAALSMLSDLVLRMKGMEHTTRAVSQYAVMMQIMDTLEQRWAGTAPAALKTSLGFLDHIGAWHPGDLVVIGARPSVGKTAMGLMIAENVARAGARVLCVCLEMSAQAMGMRALASAAQVNLLQITQASPETWESPDTGRITQAASHLANVPVDYIDSGDFGIDALCAAARLSVSTSANPAYSDMPLGLIIVDYLQLLPTPEADRGAMQRTQALGAISRKLKALARDLGVVVLALAQLNRDADREHRPHMGQLAESAHLERDADTVILLAPDLEATAYAPTMSEDAWKEETLKRVMVVVDKNRNGLRMTRSLMFNSAQQTFFDIEAPGK